MGLNIAQQSGSFDPYIKYNGKAGRWYVKDADGNEVEITPNEFVADFDKIKTGWLMFAAGMAPDKVWDASLTQPAPRPSEGHKRGFCLRLLSKDFGGVVELAACSMHLCNAINDLYNAYEVGLAQNAGKLPVVKYAGTTAMKDKQGTNYRPNFSIVKWVDRPAAFDDGAASAPTPPPVAQAPATTSEF